jgi:hypothetical protein
MTRTRTCPSSLSASTRTGTPGGGEAPSIDDQIGHDALQESWVGDCERQVVRNVDHYLETVDTDQRLGDNLVQSDRPWGDGQGAGLEAAHREQIGDQVVKAVGGVLDRGEKLRLLVRGPPHVVLPET